MIEGVLIGAYSSKALRKCPKCGSDTHLEIIDRLDTCYRVVGRCNKCEFKLAYEEVGLEQAVREAIDFFERLELQAGRFFSGKTEESPEIEKILKKIKGEVNND